MSTDANARKPSKKRIHDARRSNMVRLSDACGCGEGFFTPCDLRYCSARSIQPLDVEAIAIRADSDFTVRYCRHERFNYLLR